MLVYVRETQPKRKTVYINRSLLRTFFRTILTFVPFLAAIPSLQAADTPSAEIPKGENMYLEVVQRAADAILENAVDNIGEQKTGMIISILDCQTAKPLEGKLPPAPQGIRPADRTGPGGSNMNLQQDLYRTFEQLSRLTGDKRYSDAAQLAVSDFMTVTQHPKTGFLAWGEHLYWNCAKDCLGNSKSDAKGGKPQRPTHEPKRKFVYFEDAYRVKPEETLKYARGLWDHQIANKKTGNFSRHADYDRHNPGKDFDFPKEGSYFIDTWARAYEKSQDPEFLKAINVLAGRYLGRTNELGLLNYDSSNIEERQNKCTTLWQISLALECSDSATRVDEKTSEFLKKLADTQDHGFLLLPHEPDNPEKGFLCYVYTDSGKPRPEKRKKSLGYSGHWGMGYGVQSTPMFGLLCYSRMKQLGTGEKAEAYKKLVLRAADLYTKLKTDPRKVDIWAGEYGMVVSLELAAYRITKDKKYLDTARKVADEAIQVLWRSDYKLSPLKNNGMYAVPKASSRRAYYDVITYGDTLLLSLLALHEELNGLKSKVPISDLNR